MPRIEQYESGWRIVSDAGDVLRDGLTNAQAWRQLDIMLGEPISASEVEAKMQEPKARPRQQEMQVFFSGLLHIEAARSYKSGWAWHKFCDKFGHRPDGLLRHPCKPSASVWAWVNRKAIARMKK